MGGQWGEWKLMWCSVGGQWDEAGSVWVRSVWGK